MLSPVSIICGQAGRVKGERMETIETRFEHQAEIGVKLERGQRGGYAWEIKIVRPVPLTGVTMDDWGLAIDNALEAIDADLRRRFGTNGAEK